MLDGVRREALARLSASRASLRVIRTHEHDPRTAEFTRSAKGLLFVQNYAVYEYVVVQSVRELIAAANARERTLAGTRPELLSMALRGEFESVVDGSGGKTWQGRMALLRKARSREVAAIDEGLFPKDGSHFRPAQLRTIWDLFGLPGEVVPQPRLLGMITEMVENRNAIAHGSEAPFSVGGRFTAAEMGKRIDGTEEICTHIIETFKRHARHPEAFSAHDRRLRAGGVVSG